MSIFCYRDLSKRFEEEQVENPLPDKISKRQNFSTSREN